MEYDGVLLEDGEDLVFRVKCSLHMNPGVWLSFTLGRINIIRMKKILVAQMVQDILTDT